MKAVLYEAFSVAPKLVTVADPTPEPHGVVVKVMATGVCRSDWHGWVGHDADIRLPHVPGHELAGLVEAVGRDVTNWKKGDRVTVPFVSGCGSCPQCHSGNHQVCDNQFQPGFTHWGSFAEYVPIHYADINLVRCPRPSISPPPPAWAAALSPRSAPSSIRAGCPPGNGLRSMAAAAWDCPPS